MDMRFFNYSHLPEELRTVSRVMYDAAWWMSTTLPDGPEKSAGLRKLLEAKDCFVRSALYPAENKPVENKFPVRCTRNMVGLPCNCGQCTHIRNVAKDAK